MFRSTSRPGLSVALALLGLLACDDSTPTGAPPPDAAIDAAPDAADVAIVDATVDLPDAAAPDAAGPGTGAPAPGALCPPPMIRLYDQIVRRTEAGVRVGDIDYPIAPERALTGIAAAPGRAVGSAQIVLTLRTADGCVIDGLDERATRVWQVEAAACLPASTTPTQALLPVTDADGGAVWVLDLDTGARIRRVGLPGAPTTSAAFSGLVESGGSHWYVGAGRQVARLTPADDWRVATQATAVDVRGLAIASSDYGVVIGDLVDAEALGLGAHAQRLTFTDAAPITAGAPLALPGPAHAPPLALPPCPKFEASGGSHWWCGDGAFVLGGDGWLGGWSFADERPLLQVELNPGLRLTGLAMGRDGLVYSGGSHWLDDGGWTLLAANPGASDTLLQGDERACLPSALLDTDGQLHTQVNDLALDLPTTAGGLAPGWARAGGDAAGAGQPVAPGCDGADSLFTRIHPGPPIRPTAATVIDGEVYIAGVRGVDDAARTWVARVAPDGVFRWTLEFEREADIDPIADPPAIIAQRRGALTLFQRTADFLASRQVSFDGAEPSIARIGGDGVNRRLTAASAGPPDIILAGVYEGAEVGRDQIWIMPYVDGFLGREVATQDPVLLTPRRVVAHAPGFLIAAETERGVVLKAVDADAIERWRVAVPAPVESQLRVVGLHVSADDRVLVLLHESGVVNRTRLLVFNGVGEAMGESTLSQAEPTAMALHPDGSGLIVLADMRLARVTPTGGIAPPTDPLAIDPGAIGPGALSVAQGGGAFVLGQTRQGQLILARTSAEGYASCAAAGRCGPQAACPADDVCAAAICRPADGLCDAIPLADEMVCGARMTCDAGACGP